MAFANSSSEAEAQGVDLWKDLTCFEPIGVAASEFSLKIERFQFIFQ